MPLDPAKEFAAASAQCKGRQSKFVRAYLYGEQAGRILDAALTAGYSYETARRTMWKFVPRDEDYVAAKTGEFRDDIRHVTLAILWGSLLKAEEARKTEIGRSAARAKLNITPDRVLRSLLEIAERTAGYNIDRESGERVGDFQPANFLPGTSQRSFQLIGKDMGMFIDRGQREKKKTYDEMDLDEINEEIKKLEGDIKNLEVSERQGQNGGSPKVKAKSKTKSKMH